MKIATCQPFVFEDVLSTFKNPFLVSPGVNKVNYTLHSGVFMEFFVFTSYTRVNITDSTLPFGQTLLVGGTTAEEEDDMFLDWEFMLCLRKGISATATDPENFLGKPLPLNLLRNRSLDIYCIYADFMFLNSYKQPYLRYDPEIRVLLPTGDSSAASEDEAVAGDGGGDGSSEGWIIAVVVLIVLAVCITCIATVIGLAFFAWKKKKMLESIRRASNQNL
eukprot:TRINITY_DN4656_c0_g2_i1.p1 TRINITY_DN4656_c0_g2~~TRINITY_DN4656_c0_g2_i1.p1  ORF type:complete len:228 (+),score=24.18 TRINITY_DN4656_c0_g2_i1:25-684(+)